MTLAKRITTAGWPLMALATGLFLAACGGSSVDSSVGSPAAEAPTPTTGTFGLFITDKPSEDFAEINLDVVKAVLIGGDDAQQVLFEVADDAEPRRINLLALTNFNEPVVFGEVAVGTYTKLRLVINNLELVPHDPAADPIVIDRLPANGKIDLLDQDGFDVLPGATLLAEVDIDANKSIKVTSAGKSGKYKFRPVVKVQFSNDGAQHKLARFEGFVSDPLDPAGSFALCKTESAENCVDVMTGNGTSFFDIDGLPTDFTGVTLDAPVVVIGRYEVGTNVVLNAIVVEVGGTAEQIKGFVSKPSIPESFVLVARDESELTVELQVGTRYFNADGEIRADAIVLGTDVEVEGVRPDKANSDDPDVMRAALVFVEAVDDEQISGTINGAVDTTARTFELMNNSISVPVLVLEGSDILLVDETASEVTIGSIADLADGQSVELFGTTQVDSSFEANEIIVDVTPAT